VIETALSGIALGYVWESRARPNVDSDRPIECLAPWCPPEDRLHLYYPTRKDISVGLRAAIDAMRAD
jgi:DNA-binding transcriptional LysR family regulator